MAGKLTDFLVSSGIRKCPSKTDDTHGGQNLQASYGELHDCVRTTLEFVFYVCTHMALWRTKNTDELNLRAKEMTGEVYN